MHTPVLSVPDASRHEQAKSEHPKHRARLLHQASNTEQTAAAKEQRGLSRFLSSQQEQQAGQGRRDDEVGGVRRQPKNEWARREKGIRTSGRNGAGHVQKTPSQPIQQPDAGEVQK